MNFQNFYSSEIFYKIKCYMEPQNIKQKDKAPQLDLYGLYRTESKNHCYRSRTASSFLCY